MDFREAVSRNPQIMSGELCFHGTRVPVRNLFGYLKNGDSLEEFLSDFPGVSVEQAIVVLAASLDEIEKLIPLSA
jgi:uncharacterized protein (DUF433 family)